MDLNDALGGTNPTWPGQPAANPTWPGGQPANPTWPGGQPANPTWPGGQPANPTWPGGQPANPTWPGGQPAPGGGGGWPSPSPNPGPAPGGWPSPGPGPTGPAGPTAPGGWSGPGPAVGPGPAPHANLTVPFTHSLPNGMFDKLLVTIGGVVKPNADMFTIDITRGSDIVCHINPRFNDKGKKTIPRNSCIGNTWGKEEWDITNFPFIKGQAFEMKILCTNKEFRVAVNGTHILEFHHRMKDLRSISAIGVYKDVTLTKFNIETIR